MPNPPPGRSAPTPVTGSLLAVAALLLAPPRLADLAPLDRQAADFYGAIGTAVEVRWQAGDATPTVGGDITVSLVVSGALNPAELLRPGVELPGDALQLLDAESPRPLPDGAVAFDFRVRPRRAGATELPAVAYRYYRPDRPDGKRFLTAYADPLTLDVCAAEPLPVAIVATPVALTLPVESWQDRVPAWAWIVPVAVTLPGLALLRAAIDARRAWRTRALHPAVALARRQLAAAGDAAAIRVALHDYLAARHGLPATARTPSDVAAASPGLTAVVAVLKQCDAARFSPAGDDAVSLATDAVAAIGACERGAT